MCYERFCFSPVEDDKETVCQRVTEVDVNETWSNVELDIATMARTRRSVPQAASAKLWRHIQGRGIWWTPPIWCTLWPAFMRCWGKCIWGRTSTWCSNEVWQCRFSFPWEEDIAPFNLLQTFQSPVKKLCGMRTLKKRTFLVTLACLAHVGWPDEFICTCTMLFYLLSS